MSPAAVVLRTLTDGGQRAEDVASWLADWLGGAQRSLDIALYDVRLPGPVGDVIAAALKAAAARGVAVRIAYNLDDGAPVKPLPPPPRTEPDLLNSLGVPVKGVPGQPDLMHHKYVVRDGAAVWSGSTNWTLDSWTREENVLVTVESAQLAQVFTKDFEELWATLDVERSGRWDAPDVRIGEGATAHAWFSPGRGPELSERIANRILAARTRVRIASPLLTAAPILAALNQAIAERDADIAGVCDATQVGQVFHQWRENPQSAWKGPLLARVLTAAPWTGKRSTPYAPGAVHDYMHAKITVCDDTVFVGSFNLSRSGEQNAENVLEIADAALADQAVAFIDSVHARYPAMTVPDRF